MATEIDKTREKYYREAQAFYEAAALTDQPHWQIVFRPETFKADRIQFFKEYCNRIRSYSENNQFGGWQYPYIDPLFYNRCKESERPPWIESLCGDEERAPIQHWRFFKSGQFIHFLSFFKDDKSRRLLETGILIQTATKVFDFSGSLAQDLDSVLLVDIRMASIKDFLFCDEAMKIPGKVCTFHTLPHSCVGSTRVHQSDSQDDLNRYAREAAASLLKCLAINVSEDILKKKQEAYD